MNSVPPSASSNSPVSTDRAGEGALFVAEQLALQQCLRQRRAVDHHQRFVGQLAVLVNRPRYQLFARAAFPLNQEWDCSTPPSRSISRNTSCILAIRR